MMTGRAREDRDDTQLISCIVKLTQYMKVMSKSMTDSILKLNENVSGLKESFDKLKVNKGSDKKINLLSNQ